MKTINEYRIEFVDLLRGFAILTMILLHTNAYFLKTPLAFFIWDWGQFAVPIFIFCASYVFFKKNYRLNSVGDFLVFLKKRLIRLLLPYYFFSFVFFILVYLKEPNRISKQYVWQTLTINGGIDINWLVLLFVFFSIIMPLISFTFFKKRVLFYLFFFVSLVSAIILTFLKFPYNYRIIMSIPWSLVIFVSFYICKNEGNKKAMFLGFFFSLLSFIVFYIIQTLMKHSLIMYDNKYPPNFYHLSFCLSSIFLMYWLVKRGAFSFFPVNKYFSFLSKNSYSIYFVHYCVIYFLSVYLKIKFNWLTFFLSTLFLTSLSQLFIIFFQHYIKGRLFEYWPEHVG